MAIITIPPTHITSNVVMKMFELAYDGSYPRGMGFLHHRPGPLNDDEKESILESINQYKMASADYFNGRMMKFMIHIKSDTEIEVADVIKPDYQSWAFNYESYRALFEAAIK